MILKGAVTEFSLFKSRHTKGFYSNLFLVPKKGGGMRPVVKLYGLNEYIVRHHFKMEGIHTLKDLMKFGDWMTKVDLKDAYFIIPVHNSN